MVQTLCFSRVLSENRIHFSETRSGGAAAQSGNALLVVIGLVGVLAALGVAYQATTQSQARMYNALTARITGQTAVDAAVDLGIWRVSRDWRVNPEALERVELRCAQSGTNLTIFIENEARRLNVNFADERSIAREVSNAGVETDKASAIASYIADYVDRNSVTVDGASETEAFLAAGAISAPKNAQLDIIEELRLIPGVDEEIFGLLQAALSIHSTRTDRLRRNRAGQAAEEAAPRGVYRIAAVVASADGLSPLFSRIAVVELDPARPHAPAIRVWSRGAARPKTLSPSPSPVRDCRDVILRN